MRNRSTITATAALLLAVALSGCAASNDDAPEDSTSAISDTFDDTTNDQEAQDLEEWATSGETSGATREQGYEMLCVTASDLCSWSHEQIDQMSVTICDALNSGMTPNEVITGMAETGTMSVNDMGNFGALVGFADEFDC